MSKQPNRWTSGIRTRWAAIGAAVAVSLGAGFGSGVFVSQAADLSDEAAFVAVEPIRILDTRPGAGNVALSGKFVSAFSRDLQVTGSIPTASGNQLVVPPFATAIVANLTVVRAAAGGYVVVSPGDGSSETNTTSSVNFGPGTVIPNAVTVPLSTDGKITIEYFAGAGTGADTDILLDVVGYYTEAGLLELNRRVSNLEATSPTYLYSSGEDSITALTSTSKVIESVSVSVAERGRVNISTSGTATGFADGTATCSISASTALDNAALQIQSVATGELATMSGVRGFTIAGGVGSGLNTVTYSLVCRATGTVTFSDAHIIATYAKTDPEEFAGG